jgi:glycosyltransferase involved in cell wall biosynthesis
MQGSLDHEKPSVSIILPTYNRAAFLPQAFASIRAQHFSDWELVIVDDGGTDNTAELVAEFARTIEQPVVFIRQENQGPYGARNTGLDKARGRYIAFFDSDDLWLPHHLRDCVDALEKNPDVDWVWGACKMVEHPSGKVLAESTFYVDGKPRPFMRLRHKRIGMLHLIDDPDAARCQILHGFYCGLQNSVIRSRLFAGYRFPTHLRNEAEDQVIVLASAKRGFRFGYLDQVHVVYQVHADNSSGAAQGATLEKRVKVMKSMIQGFEDMRAKVTLTPRENRALNRRLSDDLFWQLGYALFWQNGRRNDALASFRQALRIRPWHWRFWKTYVAAAVRTKFRSTRKGDYRPGTGIVTPAASPVPCDRQ